MAAVWYTSMLRDEGFLYSADIFHRWQSYGFSAIGVRDIDR